MLGVHGTGLFYEDASQMRLLCQEDEIPQELVYSLRNSQDKIPDKQDYIPLRKFILVHSKIFCNKFRELV